MMCSVPSTRSKSQKNLVDCTIAEAKEDLQAQLRPFSRHVYNIRHQFQELRHLKEQLNRDEIIMRISQKIFS